MKLNRSYERPSELPRVIPIFPLAGALLLPRRPLPLSIFEPRFLAMVDDALTGDRLIGMIQPGGGEEASEVTLELCEIGCAGRITQFAETGDGRCFITLTGVARFRVIGEALAATPYRQARVDFAEYAADFHEGDGESAKARARSTVPACSPPYANSQKRTSSRSIGMTSKAPPTRRWSTGCPC